MCVCVLFAAFAPSGVFAVGLGGDSGVSGSLCLYAIPAVSL